MFVKRISKKSLVVDTPAKLNLYLKILGKRTDGYHDIDSLFQAVSLFDRIQFTIVENSAGVDIRLANKVDLPTDNSNLITRAFQLMKNRFGLKTGLEVKLEKNIPIAAGLGGGSADGAATILACRALFDLPLSFGEMAELSLEIGSDLPFFFSNGQAHVTGRGEKIEEIELPTNYWFVLITPALAISTADAYRSLRLPLTKTAIPRSIRGWKVPGDMVKWLADTGNDFEPVQIEAFEQLRQIKNDLLDSGAVLTRMSGSGATVFGIYFNKPEFDGDRFFCDSDWIISTVRPIRLPAQL